MASDLDVVGAAAAGDAVRAIDVAATEALSISADASLREAARLMAETPPPTSWSSTAPTRPQASAHAARRTGVEIDRDCESTREIARHLGIEQRTVKSYYCKLMRKTGADNRVKLSVSAFSRSLLSKESAKRRSAALSDIGITK